MRFVFLLLVTILLAWGVLQVVHDDGREESADLAVRSTPAAPAEETPPIPAPAATTGVLEISVRSKSGHVPAGAEAGYRVGFDDRWRRADERGNVLFTDAPLGKVRVLARAPGFEPVQQERFVNEGLRASVMIVLEPKGTSGNGR